MSLALAPAAAQSDTVDEAAQVTSFHYWVDNVAQRQTVSPTDGQAAWDIDVSALAQGLHALYYQAEDSNGRLSAPRRKDFFVATPGKGATELVGCRYWVDNVKNLQETSLSEGSTALDIDVSQLSDGLHTLFLQMKDNKGRLSPARASYFHVVRAATDVVAVRYWIDSRTNVQRTEMSGGQAAWDIDVTALSLGLHHLYYQAEDNLGQLSAPRVRHFFVSEAEQQPDNRIAAYEYWVGSGDPVRVTLDEPQQATALEGLDIATGDQTLCRVPSDYTFLPNDGIATYWAAIPFGLRVYTVAGAVSETAGADSTQVVLHLEQTALAYGDTVTTTAPRGDRIRDFLVLGRKDDSVSLALQAGAVSSQSSMAHQPLRVDLFDGKNPQPIMSFDLGYGRDEKLDTLLLPSDSTYIVVRPAIDGPVAEVPLTISLNKLEAPEPPTYHQVVVTTEGEGMVVVNRTDTIFDASSALQIEEGSRVELLFIAQSNVQLDLATLNDTIDLLPMLQDDAYIIDSLSSDVYIAAHYSYIAPVTYYAVDITAKGTGAVEYETFEVRNNTFTDLWFEGADYTLRFVPDVGSHLASATLNDSIDMMPMIVYGEYTFQEMTSDISVVAVFEADSVPPTPTDYADFAQDGILYHVTDTQLRQVRAMTVSNLQHLAMPQQVSQYGLEWTVTSISDIAFYSCPSLVSVELPATVEALAPASFSRCSHLAAIVWQADAALQLEGLDNPNMLVYVNNAEYAPEQVRNVVVGDVCSRLLLSDATDGVACADFYAPRSFTAVNAIYSHVYTLPTPIDGSYGWETLALPYDVQTITHDEQGEIAPFAALDTEGYSRRRPFWLNGASLTGFVRTETVMAYTPYLIAMPNNPIYLSEYQLAGRVTFSSHNVMVEATPTHSPLDVAGYGFVPALQRLSAAANVLALNIGGEGNLTAGSTFIGGARDLQPFQAYLTTVTLPTPMMVPVADMLLGDDTGVAVIAADTLPDGNIYDLNGRQVSASGVRSQLRKGIYVSQGRKLIVR